MSEENLEIKSCAKHIHEGHPRGEKKRNILCVCVFVCFLMKVNRRHNHLSRLTRTILFVFRNPTLVTGTRTNHPSPFNYFFVL